MGISICEPQPNCIPPQPTHSHSRSSQQSHTAPTHMGPLDGRAETCSVPIMVPMGYQTLDGGYSHLGHASVIPSASGIWSTSHSDASRSGGLSDLSLRDSPDISDTPTTEHSSAPAIQSGVKYRNSKIYLVPVGYGFRSDDRISKIIYKCIARHYRVFYPYWSMIPEEAQLLMFNEFRKYYW